MTVHRILIAVSVFAAFACPAFASFTIYSDSTSFNNATTTLFFPNSHAPITFGGSLTNSNTEYDDATTLANFFLFRSDASTSDTFTQSGTALQTPNGAGDIVKVTLPANTYAFAVNFTTMTGSGNFCMEPTASWDRTANCNYTAFATSPSSTFFGIVSTTPFQTFWIGPSSFAPAVVLNSFEVGTQAAVSETPEVATLVTIGSGLILLRLIQRRRHLQGAC